MRARTREANRRETGEQIERQSSSFFLFFIWAYTDSIHSQIDDNLQVGKCLYTQHTHTRARVPIDDGFHLPSYQIQLHRSWKMKSLHFPSLSLSLFAASIAYLSLLIWLFFPPTFSGIGFHFIFNCCQLRFRFQFASDVCISFSVLVELATGKMRQSRWNAPKNGHSRPFHLT